MFTLSIVRQEQYTLGSTSATFLENILLPAPHDIALRPLPDNGRQQQTGVRAVAVHAHDSRRCYCGSGVHRLDESPHMAARQEPHLVLHPICRWRPIRNHRLRSTCSSAQRHGVENTIHHPIDSNSRRADSVRSFSLHDPRAPDSPHRISFLLNRTRNMGHKALRHWRRTLLLHPGRRCRYARQSR